MERLPDPWMDRGVFAGKDAMRREEQGADAGKMPVTPPYAQLELVVVRLLDRGQQRRRSEYPKCPAAAQRRTTPSA